MDEKWFFAYRHINGGIKVKRYNRYSHDEAFASDFVDAVTAKYKAKNRSEAELRGSEKLAQIPRGL